MTTLAHWKQVTPEPSAQRAAKGAKMTAAHHRLVRCSALAYAAAADDRATISTRVALPGGYRQPTASHGSIIVNELSWAEAKRDMIALCREATGWNQ